MLVQGALHLSEADHALLANELFRAPSSVYVRKFEFRLFSRTRALHLLEANHALFATELFRPPRRHLQSHMGGERSLYSLESL